MNDMHKMAKKNVLENMRDEAKKMMSKKLPGVQKVEVMAKDKHGLEEGLDKAKQLAHGLPLVEGSSEEEAMESPSEEAKEHEMSINGKSPEECTPEELDEQIAMLEALKEKKLHHKE